MTDQTLRFRARGGIRVVMTVMCLLLSAYAVAGVIFDGPTSGRLIQAVFWPVAAVLYWSVLRRETTVTPSGLQIRAGTLRPRVIPTDQIVDVNRRTSYSPVRIELTSGETIELPGVRPEDFDAVRSRSPGRRLPPHHRPLPTSADADSRLMRTDVLGSPTLLAADARTAGCASEEAWRPHRSPSLLSTASEQSPRLSVKAWHPDRGSALTLT